MFFVPKIIKQLIRPSIVTDDYIIKIKYCYHDEISTKILNTYFDSVYTTNTTNFDLLPTPQLVQIQVDGDVNQSVTNNIYLLKDI